jgi:hypothetical protein
MQYAWECTDDEPVLWWESFLYYCALGPRRSVAQARTVVMAQQQREREVDMPAGGVAAEPLYSLGHWQRMARRYRWQARARAWDAWLAQRARTPSEHILLLEQRRSDLVVRQMLSRALRIFDAADLDTLSIEQARKLLPLAQGMMRSALQAQREIVRHERQAATQASPHGDGDPSSGRQEAMLETVRQVQRLIEAGVMPSGKVGEPTASALIAALDTAQAGATGAGARPAATGAPPAPQLLVVTGKERQLEMDLAMVRAVARETGLHYDHIGEATRADLETHLRRTRSKGRPITWVHMACHVSHEGVLLADGMADGAWLSRVLMGVDVLLIAGCNGDRVGDWLAVIPHVITLSDKISHDDAATLTRYFWEFLARGEPPTAALAQAMERCPQVLWEAVVAHW